MNTEVDDLITHQCDVKNDKNDVQFLSPIVQNQETIPFGLPRNISFELYQIDPICKLSSFNYKVEASIITGNDKALLVLSVVDNGAGPNLVREDLIPAHLLAKIDKSRKVVNLASASGHILDTIGVVNLSVRVGTQKTCHTFVVSKNLNADIILGCSYLDEAVEDIRIQNKTLDLLNGDQVPISRRQAAIPTQKSTSEKKALSSRTKESPFALRLAKRVSLPARTELTVPVVGKVTGLYMVVPHQRLMCKKHCVVANGVAEIRQSQVFWVKVANLSEHEVTLPKGTRMASAVKVPSSNCILAVELNKDAKYSMGRMKVSTTDEEPSSTVLEQEVQNVQPKSLQESRAFKHLSTKKERKSDIFGVDDIPPADINEDEKNKVRMMLEPYKEMWRPSYVGKVNITEHHIDIKPGSRPQFSQPYRGGPYDREVIKKTVDEMLQQDIVKRAQSEWAAPEVLAPKLDGTLRFCVDYRRLTAVTIKDRFPLPRMTDCLDSLGDAKYFSTLDCNWGFWQIPLAKEDRHKMAFTTFAGIHQYKRMPFGLCNAPASYQRTLDILLSGLKWKSCLVYVDDVIIYSTDFEDHLRDVSKVMKILEEAGLSLNMRKCKFFSRTVDYLGHVVSPGRLAVAAKNTESIRKAVYPKNQTELRSFLGACNVYRRFVPNFSHVAAPLNKLLQKGQSSNIPELTPEQKEAFNLLKASLVEPPVLQLPDPDKALSIDADASNYQAGCALFQSGEDGMRHPIGFWSRSLTKEERNYSAGEREALAIIFAVETLHPYLWGKHFVVYTDHQALRWVFNLNDPTGRLCRWALRLQPFDFEVRYKKGVIMSLPTVYLDYQHMDIAIPKLILISRSLLSANQRWYEKQITLRSTPGSKVIGTRETQRIHTEIQGEGIQEMSRYYL